MFKKINCRPKFFHFKMKNFKISFISFFVGNFSSSSKAGNAKKILKLFKMIFFPKNFPLFGSKLLIKNFAEKNRTLTKFDNFKVFGEL